MPTALLALFPLFFVALWIVVCRLCAVLGGWTRLAEAYPDTCESGDDVFHTMLGQAVQIGRVTYKGCVTIRATRAGLHMRPMILFRPGHAALHIPWDEVQVSPGTAWLWRTADLRTSRVPSVRIRMSWSLAEKIAEATSGAFRLAAAGAHDASART